MHCKKHPWQKMTLLFSSYVCDVCDPPRNAISVEAQGNSFHPGQRVRTSDKHPARKERPWKGVIKAIPGARYVLVDDVQDRDNTVVMIWETGPVAGIETKCMPVEWLEADE